MNSFWVNNRYRIVGAIGLAGLYVCVLGVWWVLTGAQGGERFGFMLALLNLPIFLLMEFVMPWIGQLDFMKRVSHIENIYPIIVGFGGVLQYGLIGWWLGPVLERFDREGQQKCNKE